MSFKDSKMEKSHGADGKEESHDMISEKRRLLAHGEE